MAPGFDGEEYILRCDGFVFSVGPRSGRLPSRIAWVLRVHLDNKTQPQCPGNRGGRNALRASPHAARRCVLAAFVSNRENESPCANYVSNGPRFLLGLPDRFHAPAGPFIQLREPPDKKINKNRSGGQKIDISLMRPYTPPKSQHERRSPSVYCSASTPSPLDVVMYANAFGWFPTCPTMCIKNGGGAEGPPHAETPPAGRMARARSRVRMGFTTPPWYGLPMQLAAATLRQSLLGRSADSPQRGDLVGVPLCSPGPVAPPTKTRFRVANQRVMGRFPDRRARVQSGRFSRLKNGPR